MLVGPGKGLLSKLWSKSSKMGRESTLFVQDCNSCVLSGSVIELPNISVDASGTLGTSVRSPIFSTILESSLTNTSLSLSALA